MLGAWLLLHGCGSGNLGKVPESVGVAPPPTESTSSAAPAEQPSSSASQEPRCGDGVLQRAAGELCDGDDLGRQTCASLGLGNGSLHCDPRTCLLVTTGCEPEPQMTAPPMDGGMDDAALPLMADAEAGLDAGASCPTGFSCGMPVFQGTQAVCMQWAEETPPVCFTPGSDQDCAAVLPGSTCTRSNLGSFCTLPCTH